MKARYLILSMVSAVIFLIFALTVFSRPSPMTLEAPAPLSMETVNFLIYFTLYIAVPVPYFWYHFRKQGRSVRQVVFTEGIKDWIPRLLALVLVLIAFSLSVFWLQLFALMPVAPWLVELFLEPAPLSQSPVYLVIEVAFLGVIGPIAEEFIFRGVLLNRLIRKTSMWGGILISSMLFGALHADILGAFLFGVVASLLFIKTRNLLVPILLHIFNNLLAVLSAFAFPAFPEALALLEPSDVYDKALPNALLLLAASVALGVLLKRLIRSLKPSYS